MIEDEVKTFYGTYAKNTITQEDGSSVRACSYKSLNKVIENKVGYFNCKYASVLDVWIIFQFVETLKDV